MSSLAGRTVRSLFAAASSTDPAPGGGSVTALCGLLGVALVLKALRISLRRRPDAGFEAADGALAALADRLAAHADADAEAFEAVIAALKLPREPDVSARARDLRLQAAAARAAQVGLAALEDAAKAIEAAEGVRAAINRQMAPDLEAGLDLLQVMRRNAIHNAEENLAVLKDEAARAGLARRLEALKGGEPARVG